MSYQVSQGHHHLTERNRDCNLTQMWHMQSGGASSCFQNKPEKQMYSSLQTFENFQVHSCV